MAAGERAMSKGKELVHTNVYNMKYYFVAPHEINHSSLNVSLPNYAVEEGATVLDTSSFHILANVW